MSLKNYIKYNNNIMESYAYISLLYPDKKGNCGYLDGAILTALGLRKQRTKHKIICMVTPDVPESIKENLLIVYDSVIVVDYIAPFDGAGIQIDKEIFDPSNLNTEMSKVFTKLHIFDKIKFPFKKVIFVDCDLIPIKEYDTLFELDTPAGWPEHILENNIKTDSPLYTRIWDVWLIDHGFPIPREITDVYKKPGTDINAGLMVIEPDEKVFNDFITTLKKPKNEWLGKDHFYKGTINVQGEFIERYLEQPFLTQHFSGSWKMIDGRFCAWGFREEVDTCGVHMAGLRYLVNDKWTHYKTWMLQIPVEDGMNNVTNQTCLWGFKKYPKLKNILMKNLKFYIYGSLKEPKDLTKLEYWTLNDLQKKLLKEII